MTFGYEDLDARQTIRVPEFAALVGISVSASQLRTYANVMPGQQADAAATFAELVFGH